MTGSRFSTSWCGRWRCGRRCDRGPKTEDRRPTAAHFNDGAYMKKLIFVLTLAPETSASVRTKMSFFMYAPSLKCAAVGLRSSVFGPRSHLRPHRQRPHQLVEKREPVIVRLHPQLLVAPVHVVLAALG